MNIALPVILFFLLGILLYYIDLKVGVQLYRKWYKLTHKDPLPVGIQRGFIVNSSLESLFGIALILIVAEVLLSFQIGNSPPLLDILLGVLGFIGLMLGFYLGGILMKGMGKTIGYLEHIEKGELDLGKELVKGVKKAREAIKEEKTNSTDDSEVQEEHSETKEDDKPEKDWRDGVDDFLKK
ncbi:MAG: hypothetical protein HKN92_02680 [Chitinophagales bacterium]|nr:hypothetical protein [Chitinophagales bacterium]